MYKDGLVRLSTQPYTAPTDENLVGGAQGTIHNNRGGAIEGSSFNLRLLAMPIVSKNPVQDNEKELVVPMLRHILHVCAHVHVS